MNLSQTTFKVHKCENVIDLVFPGKDKILMFSHICWHSLDQYFSTEDLCTPWGCGEAIVRRSVSHFLFVASIFVISYSAYIGAEDIFL